MKTEKEIAQQVIQLLEKGKTRLEKVGYLKLNGNDFICICDALKFIVVEDCERNGNEIETHLPKFYGMFSNEVTTHNRTNVQRKESFFWWADTPEGIQQRIDALKKCYGL